MLYRNFIFFNFMPRDICDVYGLDAHVQRVTIEYDRRRDRPTEVGEDEIIKAFIEFY